MASGEHDPAAWITGALAEWSAADLRRDPICRAGRQGPEIAIAGRRWLNFGSNDYLNLAADERLINAAAAAAQREGWGSGASPLVIGRSESHERLEARLAEFEQCEAALVFPTGFAANLSSIPALVGRGDCIFADELNHASLIDGCRLSRADVRVYPHANVNELAALLRAAPNEGRRLIATDSVFSMDGDLAPLAEIAALAERHDAMTLVDEAHATGVFGAGGRGLTEELGLEDRMTLRIGTLSKALGGLGGFAVGRRAAIDWLYNKARAYVFSTAPPPAACAAALAALDIVESEPRRRATLLASAQSVREQLRAQGWNIGASASQIVPVIVGSACDAIRLGQALAARALFVPVIRPPSVPAESSRLRISLSSGHTSEMIARLLDAFAELRRDA